MKRIFNIISLLGVLCMGLASCQESKEEVLSKELAIKVFSPVRVAPGATVSINGNGLDKVKTVTLAGKEIKEITVVSANMIKVKVPATDKAVTGEVTVATDKATAKAKVEINIVLPEITAYEPIDKVIGGSNITFFGTDLEAVTEVHVPGDFVIPSSDFQRKSNHTIVVTVPRRVPSGNGVAVVKTSCGTEYTTGEIEFVENRPGHYEDAEVTIYEPEKPYTVTYSKPLYIMKEWYSDWAVGMPFHVYCNPIEGDGGKHEVKLLGGDGKDYPVPDAPFNNSIWYTKMAGPEVLTIVITQKLWDDCFADDKLYKGRAFRFSGKNYEVTKVTVDSSVWVWDD